MRAVIAVLVLLVTAYISWTWVFTIPKCLSSGWGTPGYWVSPKSLEDDDGAFGCWWKTVTKEQVRQQAYDAWVQDSERQARLRAQKGYGW